MAQTTVPAQGSGILEALRKVASNYLFRRLVKALITVFVIERVTGWLPASDPIYQNSPYEDCFTVIMLMDGTLKPAGQ